MVLFKPYLIFQCPKCGKWQIKHNRKYFEEMTDLKKSIEIKKISLVCKYCNTTRKLWSSKLSIKIKHYWADYEKQARAILKEITNNIIKNRRK